MPALSVCHGCLHLSSTLAVPPSAAVSVQRLPSGSLCLPSSLSHPRAQQIRAFVPADVPSRPSSSVHRATCLRLILRSHTATSLLFRAFHPLSVLSFSGAQALLVAISLSFSCNTHINAHLHERARYLDTYTQTARKPLARRSNNLRSSLGARYGGISGRERSLFWNVSPVSMPESSSFQSFHTVEGFIKILFLVNIVFHFTFVNSEGTETYYLKYIDN